MKCCCRSPFLVTCLLGLLVDSGLHRPPVVYGKDPTQSKTTTSLRRTVDDEQVTVRNIVSNDNDKEKIRYLSDAGMTQRQIMAFQRIKQFGGKTSEHKIKVLNEIRSIVIEEIGGYEKIMEDLEVYATQVYQRNELQALKKQHAALMLSLQNTTTNVGDRRDLQGGYGYIPSLGITTFLANGVDMAVQYTADICKATMGLESGFSNSNRPGLASITICATSGFLIALRLAFELIP